MEDPTPQVAPDFSSPEVLAAIAQLDAEYAERRARVQRGIDRPDAAINSFVRYTAEEGGTAGGLPETELTVCHLGVLGYRKFNCGPFYT